MKDKAARPAPVQLSKLSTIVYSALFSAIVIVLWSAECSHTSCGWLVNQGCISALVYLWHRPTEEILLTVSVAKFVTLMLFLWEVMLVQCLPPT